MSSDVSVEEFEGFMGFFDPTTALCPGYITEKEFKLLINEYERQIMTMGGLEIQEEETPGNLSGQLDSSEILKNIQEEDGGSSDDEGNNSSMRDNDSFSDAGAGV